jgi:hypothetical protein
MKTLKNKLQSLDALDSRYSFGDHSFTLLNSAYKKATGNSLAMASLDRSCC